MGRFLAGWGFVTGKSASIAAMAYTFALYVVPGAGTGGADWTARWVAVAAVVLLTGVNLLGITRTVQATVAIVVPVVLILAVVITAGFLSPGATPARPVPRPWPTGSGSRGPGAVGGAAGRRAAVLRLRGLRPDRDAR